MKYRIRKEAILVFAVLIILTVLLIFKPNGGAKIKGTNLDGLTIEKKNDGSDIIVNFGENDSYSLGNPPEMLLIVNGSIFKHSNIRVIDGSSLISVESFVKSIGAKLKSDTSNDEYSISEGDTKITFKLGEQSANISGKPTFLDFVPVREGQVSYVPLKQFYDIFGYKVDYSDGRMNHGMVPTIPGYQQIMVYKYSDKRKVTNSSDAVMIFKDTLKKAYKNNFGESWKEPSLSEQAPEYKEGYATNKQELIRFLIRDVNSVVDETDRYYRIGTTVTFLYDKYTDNIYILDVSGEYNVVSLNLVDSKDRESLK